MYPISPFVIQPDTSVSFEAYLKRNDNYVLLTTNKECFRETRNRLYENGVTTIYIKEDEISKYYKYIDYNLGNILKDKEVPIETRSEILKDNSVKKAKALFGKTISKPEGIREIKNLVREAVDFFFKTGSVNPLSDLITHTHTVYTHCFNVFVYAGLMFKNMDLTKKDVQRYALGAYLHDVGKINIDKSILDKPGNLTEEEIEIIKTHPQEGIEVCKDNYLPETVKQGILFHHERIDGKGYPRGYTDDQIPFPAKVIGCCDIYDALTTHRSYAKATSPFEALKIIREDVKKGKIDEIIFKHLISIIEY